MASPHRQGQSSLAAGYRWLRWQPLSEVYALLGYGSPQEPKLLRDSPAASRTPKFAIGEGSNRVQQSGCRHWHHQEHRLANNNKGSSPNNRGSSHHHSSLHLYRNSTEGGVGRESSRLWALRLRRCVPSGSGTDTTQNLNTGGGSMTLLGPPGQDIIQRAVVTTTIVPTASCGGRSERVSEQRAESIKRERRCVASGSDPEIRSDV